MKPRSKEEQGQQKKVESLIHHSNVMHYSTTQQVRDRGSHALGVAAWQLLSGAWAFLAVLLC